MEGIMAIQRVINTEGDLSLHHRIRPLQIAVTPTHVVKPQPVKLTVRATR